ncbi:MAG: phosphoglycerate mutase family protein [Nakamurella sp.]
MSDPRSDSGSTAPVGAVELWLVRHGESAGNVAATAAQQAGAEVIDIDVRDADVPLTERGAQQAAAFGTLLAAGGADDRSALPDAIWCSPYLRARQTAEIALREAGIDTWSGWTSGCGTASSASWTC